MTYEQAKRLVTHHGENNLVSYWSRGEEVYRLQEYEPVQFDIYGLPLGARWECNLFNWPDLRKLLPMPEASVPYVEVDTETAYGSTQRMQRSIRVF